MPTWKVKKCVEDVETFCVITLDKLVGIELSDVRAGREHRNIEHILHWFHQTSVTKPIRRGPGLLTLAGS